jgi:hypothetical protein
MADRPRDPILKIEPVDPFNPQPVIIELKFDTAKEVEGQYGTQYLYGVKSEGKDYVLFASKALDEAIVDTGAASKDRVAIVRTGEGKDTRWTARLVDGSGRPIANKAKRPGPAQPENGYEDRGAPAPAPRPAPAVKPFDDRLADFLTEESLYLHAMRRAMNALPDGAPKPSLDLNAVAFVLYRMAKDHRITLDGSGQPVIEEDPLAPDIRNALDRCIQLLVAMDDMPDDLVPADELLAVAKVLFNANDLTWHNVTIDQMRRLYSYTASCKTYVDFVQPPGEDGEVPF